MKDMSLVEFARQAMPVSLARNGWITTPTCRESGTSTTTLRHKLQGYGLNND